MFVCSSRSFIKILVDARPVVVAAAVAAAGQAISVPAEIVAIILLLMLLFWLCHAGVSLVLAVYLATPGVPLVIECFISPASARTAVRLMSHFGLPWLTSRPLCFVLNCFVGRCLHRLWHRHTCLVGVVPVNFAEGSGPTRVFFGHEHIRALVCVWPCSFWFCRNVVPCRATRFSLIGCKANGVYCWVLNQLRFRCRRCPDVSSHPLPTTWPSATA